MKFKNSSFALFFRFFPKLFSAGVIYSASLAVCVGLFALIGYISGFNNIIVLGLGIIPSTPMLSGVVMIIRKIAIEKKNVKLLSTYFEAVKENYKIFLIHGVVLYLITACTFFSVLYYGSLAAVNITYASILTIYMLFTAILITAFFYIPVMSVTYELGIKDIYRNSFLLVFGNILKNILSLVIIVILSLIVFYSIIFTDGVFRIITVIISAALYPLLVNYISISLISGGLQENVGSITETDV